MYTESIQTFNYSMRASNPVNLCRRMMKSITQQILSTLNSLNMAYYMGKILIFRSLWTMQFGKIDPFPYSAIIVLVPGVWYQEESF